MPTHPLHAFVTEFYLASDRPTDQWVDMFAPDAELLIGERRASGIDAIRALRDNGAKAVANRVHYLDSVYYNPEQPHVALATGTIDQDRLADGEQIRGLEWAAKIEMRGDKIAKYTAFVVSPLRGARLIVELSPAQGQGVESRPAFDT